MFPVRASPTVPGSTEVDVTTASLRSWSGAKTNMRTMSGCIRRASLMHSLRMSVIRSYPRHRKCVEILPRSTPCCCCRRTPTGPCPVLDTDPRSVRRSVAVPALPRLPRDIAGRCLPTFSARSSWLIPFTVRAQRIFLPIRMAFMTLEDTPHLGPPR